MCKLTQLVLRRRHKFCRPQIHQEARLRLMEQQCRRKRSSQSPVAYKQLHRHHQLMH
jgi:hypothetical protein